MKWNLFVNSLFAGVWSWCMHMFTWPGGNMQGGGAEANGERGGMSHRKMHIDVADKKTNNKQTNRRLNEMKMGVQ